MKYFTKDRDMDISKASILLFEVLGAYGYWDSWKRLGQSGRSCTSGEQAEIMLAELGLTVLPCPSKAAIAAAVKRDSRFVCRDDVTESPRRSLSPAMTAEIQRQVREVIRENFEMRKKIEKMQRYFRYPSEFNK